MKELKSKPFLTGNNIDTEFWLVATRDKEDRRSVFIYAPEGFLVPASEGWKTSNKLKNVSNNTGVFESKNSQQWLEPEDVRPGMIGEDYFQCYGRVELIYDSDTLTEEQLEKLKEYDEDGTFGDYDKINRLQSIKEFNSGKWLVAVQYIFDNPFNDDTVTKRRVLQYGSNGILVPISEGWKKSNKLMSTSDKTGVLEHLITFENWKESKKLKRFDDITGTFSSSETPEYLAEQILKEYFDDVKIKKMLADLEKLCIAKGYDGYDGFIAEESNPLGIGGNIDDRQTIHNSVNKLHEKIEKMVSKHIGSVGKMTDIAVTLLNGGPYENLKNDLINILKKVEIDIEDYRGYPTKI